MVCKLLASIISQLEEYSASLPANFQGETPELKVCENCDNFIPTLHKVGVPWTERRCHYCDGVSGWASVQGYINQLKSSYPENVI